jgi:hypothetical protein
LGILKWDDFFFLFFSKKFLTPVFLPPPHFILITNTTPLPIAVPPVQHAVSELDARIEWTRTRIAELEESRGAARSLEALLASYAAQSRHEAELETLHVATLDAVDAHDRRCLEMLSALDPAIAVARPSAGYQAAGGAPAPGAPRSVLGLGRAIASATDTIAHLDGLTRDLTHDLEVVPGALVATLAPDENRAAGLAARIDAAHAEMSEIDDEVRNFFFFFFFFFFFRFFFFFQKK